MYMCNNCHNYSQVGTINLSNEDCNHKVTVLKLIGQ